MGEKDKKASRLSVSSCSSFLCNDSFICFAPCLELRIERRTLTTNTEEGRREEEQEKFREGEKQFGKQLCYLRLVKVKPTSFIRMKEKKRREEEREEDVTQFDREEDFIHFQGTWEYIW